MTRFAMIATALGLMASPGLSQSLDDILKDISAPPQGTFPSVPVTPVPAPDLEFAPSVSDPDAGSFDPSLFAIPGTSEGNAEADRLAASLAFSAYLRGLLETAPDTPLSPQNLTH